MESKKIRAIKVGIIGGSGLGNAEFFKDRGVIPALETPYGKTSSDIITGKIGHLEVAVLARHGHKHSIIPSNVPNRANIRALKDLGVTHMLATTACGSLRDRIKPGQLVFPDQFIDATRKRASTFFEGPEVCHISMAEPFCKKLREKLIETAKGLRIAHHPKGTIITIEGPRFSTRAESRMFRAWGADVINMSTVPECVLAREAGICYATIAMATDYDCFDEKRAHVTWDEVLRTMEKNVGNVKKLLAAAIPKIEHIECSCMTDVEKSIMK